MKNKKVLFSFALKLAIFVLIFSLSLGNVLLTPEFARAEEILEPEPFCSDGNLDQGEECDDGNTEAGDGCSTDCFLETENESYCGENSNDKDGNTDDDCELVLTKSDSTDPVQPGDELTYYLTLENVGTTDCTGSGVKLEDEFDDYTSYISADPTPKSVYAEYLQWNFGTLEPGDFVEAELTMLVSEETPCNTTLLNRARFWSEQTLWGYDITEETEVVCFEYESYCGDGEVNQDWEQCDTEEGCTEQCLWEEQTECNDLVLARINSDEINNFTGEGDMTSDVYLGSDSNVIPGTAWFALYWNGTYYIDSDLAAYEDVPGYAVERLEDSLRVVMHGTQTNQDKEHAHGNIEFYNADVTGQENDPSNAYPGNNTLENGFNGTGVGSYNPNNDEVWLKIGDADHSYYWLTTTTADDGYYTNWQIIEDCDDSISGVKFYDNNQDGLINGEDYNLSDWTINLWPKLECEEGDEWADSVVGFSQGLNSTGTPVIAERSHPAEALGVAENDDTINFVSLGFGGKLILSFDNFIENGPGDDIEVFETSYGNPGCHDYPEVVHVYASQYGTTWEDLGRACQDGTFDLGSLPWAKYIRLVDETDPENFSGVVDGYDVDGVKAIHCLNRGEKMSTVTTEDGYSFSGLSNGGYLICEELQEGWINTTPLCQQVTIQDPDASELTNLTVNFGNYYPEVQVADYEISKTLLNLTPEEIYPGDTVEFLLSVENTGELDIYQMHVVDDFDSDYLSFLSATTTMPEYISTSTVAWYSEFSSITPLVVGGVWTRNIFFLVNDAITENVSTTNTLTTLEVIDENGDPVEDAEANALVNIVVPIVGPYCGDGNLDQGEECDDGNNTSGDGCSAACTIEGGGGGGGGCYNCENAYGGGSIEEEPEAPEPEVLGVKIEEPAPEPEVLGYKTLPNTGTNSNNFYFLLSLGLLISTSGVTLRLRLNRYFKV